MNRICSDPKYRDILTSILIQIKDIETYNTFFSVCSNMRDTCAKCQTPLYFRITSYRPGCAKDAVKYISGILDTKFTYNGLKNVILKKKVSKTGNTYLYRADSHPFSLHTFICKEKDGSILILEFNDASELDDITVKKTGIYSEPDKYVVVAFAEFKNESVGWRVNVYGESKYTKVNFERRIPTEFASNGSTHFETEEGVKYLDQVRAIIPFDLKYAVNVSDLDIPDLVDARDLFY
jgi:hypothetical protein